MTKIYSLRFDYALYPDGETDGEYRGDINSIPGSTLELCGLEQQPGTEMPEVFDFDTSNITRLKDVDFAYVNSFVDVISQDLIDTLRPLEPSWTLMPARFFDADKEVCNDRFSAVFFEYFCDYFDYDKSEYDPIDWSIYPPDKVTERRRKEVGVIRNLVLKEPDEGFQPCFRLLAYPVNLYVSEPAHDAIISADLSGLTMDLIGDY